MMRDSYLKISMLPFSPIQGTMKMAYKLRIPELNPQPDSLPPFNHTMALAVGQP